MNRAINQEGKYVVILLLPIEQIEPFTKWIDTQTVPIIESEGENSKHCAWLWDYERWYRSWSVGRVAEIFD